MKFALVTTAFRPDTIMVEELYIRDVAAWQHTKKLSDARLWDSFDEIADLVESEEINDAKIVRIKDKDLFEARLKDK
jgi:hypothetical protein